jgi:hypothetical protein
MMSRNRCVAALCVSLALLLQGCGTTPERPQAPPATQSPAPAPEPAPQPSPEAVTAPAPTLPAEPALPPEEPEPAPEPEPPVVCTPPPPPPAPAKRAPPQTALAVLGEIEHVRIEPPGLQFTARLDTGMAGSSLHALDVRAFERDGKTWVKFQLVDAGTGKNVEVSRPVVRSIALKGAADSKRYIVSLKTTIAGVAQFTEFALTDRSSSSYPVLIGRNFLRDQAVVDVGRRYTRPE